MTKEKLVEKVNDLLRTNADLNFLLGLKKEEIERVVACIRDRLDQMGKRGGERGTEKGGRLTITI